MQLYCLNGIVAAYYDDGTVVDPTAHPGATIIQWTKPMSELGYFGNHSPGWVSGMSEDRPFVAPAMAPALLAAYAAAKQSAVLAAGGTVNVAASGQPAVPVLCDGTSDTRADLALLGLFGQQSPTATKVWLDNNGVSTNLTGAQYVTLTTSIGNWVASTYATLGAVLASIAANPPTITTTAQVDAAFAADTTV